MLPAVSLIVPLIHEPRIAEHAGEYGVLVDCSVLYAAVALPYNLLLLLKPPVKQVYLHRETVLLDVSVEIF